MRDALHEARLKVKRANEHIADLNTRLQRFSQTDSYVIHVNFDADTGCDVLRLETIETIPDEFLLIIGDALNNLRTALDYVIYRLSTKPDEFTKFPIYETRQKLEVAVNGGLKSKVSSDVIRFIVDTVQPYLRGDGEILWHLNQLNNIDKHRLLIAKRHLTFVSGIRLENENGTEFIVPDWLIVYPLIASHPIKGERNIKVTNNGKAASTIVFGDGMPMEGRDIPPSLSQLSIFIEHTLRIFDYAIRNGLR